MGKDEKKPLMQVIRENASAFAIFLYNSEEKTVLGRNSASWGKYFSLARPEGGIRFQRLSGLSSLYWRWQIWLAIKQYFPKISRK